MSQAIDNGRFIAFVEDPTLKRFRNLQRIVVRNPDYDPNSDDLRFLNRLFQKHRFDQVLERADDLFTVWQLSPNFHFHVGNSAVKIGDQETAEVSKRASRACLNSLLETGDGSLEEPFQITYLADETDILTALDSDVRWREVVETDQGFCDVATCHDGSEIWFDVDQLLSAKRAAKATNAHSSAV